MLTQKVVQEYFDYKDGILYWKVKAARRVTVDSPAGSFDPSNGYHKVHILKKFHKTHRVIFLYHHGYLPDFVDHIDGDKLNNKIENLRAATKSQNCMNQKISTRNTSGTKGVMWHKRDKKWWVALRVNSILHNFGYYDDKELAELVAIEATNKLHKDFSAYKGVLHGQ
jgi:uncharacterized protein YdaL